MKNNSLKLVLVIMLITLALTGLGCDEKAVDATVRADGVALIVRKDTADRQLKKGRYLVNLELEVLDGGEMLAFRMQNSALRKQGYQALPVELATTVLMDEKRVQLLEAANELASVQVRKVGVRIPLGGIDPRSTFAQFRSVKGTVSETVQFVLGDEMTPVQCVKRDGTMLAPKMRMTSYDISLLFVGAGGKADSMGPVLSARDLEGKTTYICPAGSRTVKNRNL